jgi:MFS family permease
MPSSAATAEPLLTWPFLRLCLFAFLAFLAAFQLFPSMPFRLIDLGSSRADAGLFLTVYTWASALSAPFTGALADRFGRRRMLVLAAGAFALFSLLYGIVRPLPLLLAVACLHGFFWSGMLSATGALIADVIPVARRTEGIGYYGMSATAAVAVAPAIGLAVYHHGWLVLMIELAVMALALLAMATQVREAARPTDEVRNRSGAHHAAVDDSGDVVSASAPPSPRLPRLTEALSWRVVASASGLFLVALPYGGITSYAALLAAERHIAPRSLFFTVFALTVLATRIVLPRLADRYEKPMLLLLVSLVLVPPGLALLGLAHSRAMLVVAGIVFATGFGNAYPTFMTWVLARTDPRQRAATFGSVLLAFDTAIGTGSLLVGALGDRIGLGPAFLVLAAMSALALPTFVATRRLLPAGVTPG